MASVSEKARGATSAVSPLTSDLLARDTRPLETAMHAVGEYRSRGAAIPMARYYEPAFAALEKERLWTKVWQFAGCEEDIPEVGDRVPYAVADLTFMAIPPDQTREGWP